MLFYGPVHKKDARQAMAANEHVYAGDYAVSYVEGSDHLADARVRAMAITQLMNVPDVALAARSIVDKERSLLGDKKDAVRFHDNSYAHTIKHRCSQALLLAASSLPHQKVLGSSATADAEALLAIALSNIEAAGQVLSVRYVYEWTCMVLLAACPGLEPRIRDALDRAAATDRLAVVPAYISILAHACPDASVPDVLALVAPWCMGQQFGTRVCAFASTKRLMARASELGLGAACERFAVVGDCIDRAVGFGSSGKNEEKLMGDFYLNDFDPAANLNLADVFYNFPRLAGVKDVLPYSSFSFPDQRPIWPQMERYCNASSNLSRHRERFCRCVECHEKSRQNDAVPPESMFSEVHQQGDGQVQKKIVPWSEMLDLEAASRKPAACPHLIVVASLVDRPPNLGGLCRTCEIFGAGKYVVANKKVTEDKEFQSVSVTAHQWVDIEAVEPSSLVEYLQGKKCNEGFTVVAVEQTSQSVSLDNFELPEKSVILLGNEKEGIPVDLIRIVDVCVEIPQTGLIRSLNVHVTGAIAIWEYVRQLLGRKSREKATS